MERWTFMTRLCSWPKKPNNPINSSKALTQISPLATGPVQQLRWEAAGFIPRGGITPKFFLRICSAHPRHQVAAGGAQTQCRSSGCAGVIPKGNPQTSLKLLKLYKIHRLAGLTSWLNKIPAAPENLLLISQTPSELWGVSPEQYK